MTTGNFAHRSTSPTSRHRTLQFSTAVGTSEIRATAYSARGSAFTTLTLGSGKVEEVPTAGVIAAGWPGWATAFSMQRLRLKWIVLHDAALVTAVQESFRHVKVLHLPEVHWNRLQAVDVVGFNGPIESSGEPLTFGLFYFWDWDVRFRWPSWTFLSNAISHAECGGVSDFLGSITVGTRDQLKIPAVFHVQSPPGELGSILGGKTGGRALRTAPSLKALDIPVVQPIGLHCYHPRGLYPLQDQKAKVVTRYVFGSQSKWVERELTADEMLQVFDFPPQVYSRWSKTLKLTALTAVRVPIKVLVAVASTIILLLGLQVGGGVVEAAQEGVGVVQTSVVEATEVPSDLGAELPTNWREGIRVVTSEAATKADDAEVPIYLWNDRLMEDLGLDDRCTDKQCEALEVIRRGILCYWRYRLTRCFCRWIRCQECEFLKSDNLYKVHSTSIPEKREQREKPSSKLKWTGCERCGKEEKRKEWKFEKYACLGRGGYAWKNKQTAIPEVMYEAEAYGGKGGFIWCTGGREMYQKWRRTFTHVRVAGMKDSIGAGVDCITRATKTSAWEWDGGSRPFFWRWGREYWQEARDGAKVWVKGDLPSCKEKQRVPREKDIYDQVKKKVTKVRKRGYLGEGLVNSLTSFFEVMKVLNDIRMVYNATSSGLNDAVWAPWFSLPTAACRRC